jgi:hypothetical protein
VKSVLFIYGLSEDPDPNIQSFEKRKLCDFHFTAREASKFSLRKMNEGETLD